MFTPRKKLSRTRLQKLRHKNTTGKIQDTEKSERKLLFINLRYCKEFKVTNMVSVMVRFLEGEMGELGPILL